MVDPSIWGPHAWIFLHSITFGYPNCPSEQDKVNMRLFFDILPKVIPCNKCKMNFIKHLQQYPLTEDILCSKRELIKWLIDIHNEVNKMNFKNPLGYDQAISLILNNQKSNSNYLMIGAATIFVIILVIIVGLRMR